MVIKHLFQSPIDLRQLHEAVGEFIHFIVYPSVENPLSMEFFPKVGWTFVEFIVSKILLSVFLPIVR